MTRHVPFRRGRTIISIQFRRRRALLCGKDASNVRESDYDGNLTYQATRTCSVTVFKLLPPLEAYKKVDLDRPRTSFGRHLGLKCSLLRDLFAHGQYSGIEAVIKARAGTRWLPGEFSNRVRIPGSPRSPQHHTLHRDRSSAVQPVKVSKRVR